MSSYPPPPPPGPQDPTGGPGNDGPEGRYGPGSPYPVQYPDQSGAGAPYPASGDPYGQYPGANPAEGGYGYGQYPGPAPVGPDDPLVPRSFSDWAAKVVGVVSRSWQPLLLVQLVAALPGLVLGGLVEGATAAPGPPSGGALAGVAIGAGVAALISLVFGLFAQGASVFVAVRDAVGRPAKAGEALSFAARRALPLFGWGLLAAVLLLVGFLLLFLPGLYLLIVFGAALTGVVVIERQGIGRAFALVNRRFWPTAGRLLVAGLAALVYNWIVSHIVGLAAGPGTFTASLLGSVLLLPLSLASVGVAVVTYTELRNHENPGVGSAALAAQMEG